MFWSKFWLCFWVVMILFAGLMGYVNYTKPDLTLFWINMATIVFSVINARFSYNEIKRIKSFREFYDNLKDNK